MTKKIIRNWLFVFTAALFLSMFSMNVNAAQQDEMTEATEESEETTQETIDREATPLTFEIAIYTYEIIPNIDQEDLPTGFTLTDYEYNGQQIKAGVTENSDMVCVMAEDWETGYTYRFIYDPAHEMFVPYFGAEIKNGYIYTIPMYDGAEIPYGFVDSYFLIQTVPMFCYMREDAELTQEEIAVGSLSEDNYLVFLMMDENGEKVYYTYDLIDRTYQRSLLQLSDAEKVTELNHTIDELSNEIGKLNAAHTKRMNQRLTLIGILIAAVLIMAGVIVNLLLKGKKAQSYRETEAYEDYDEDEDSEDDWGIADEEEEIFGEEPEVQEEEEEDLEILDLDLED